MRYDHSIYAVAAALLLTACTQDIAQEFFAGNDDNSVTFTAQTIMTEDETRSVSAPEALPLTGDGLNLWLMPSETPMAGDATRGTQINSVSELSSFGVSAFKHGAIPSGKTLNEYLADNHLKPDFFYNMEATKVTGTEKFKLTTNYYWPASNETLSFFAYAPYGDGNVGLSAETAEGPQVITFKVNTVVKDQADFMTAQASSTAHTSASETPSVRLNFTHHLTGVRFVLGDQFLKGWVKSISLKGVYTEGKYTIGGNWTLDDTKKGNFTISYNMDKPVTDTPGETVTAPNETFLMIPHTFADDDAATIEVVYNDGYTDYIVSAPLKGQTWKAGKTVTYAITSKKLTTLQIASIKFPDTPEGAYKREWAAGDKVGMYVVGSDGMKLKHKNIPVTFDGTKWNIDHTTSEGTIYKLPGESFYFYYPYSTVSNNQPLGYPEQCPELKADAPTFFEGVIQYFSIKTDQSSPSNHIASDLQVAKAEDEGHASTIKATMLRQVGLARFKFATKKTVYTKVFLNNNQQSSTPTTIYPSTNFENNTPYLGDNGIYFFFTKANVITTFNSNPSDANHWKEAVNITLAAGECTSDTKMVTVKDCRDGVIINDYTYNYSKTGTRISASYFTFTAPTTGKYTIECWGASSDDGTTVAPNNIRYLGYGGYVKGSISLSSSKTLYVYLGGMGLPQPTDGSKYRDGYISNTGGYNGGGNTSNAGCGGGGATDIRLYSNGTWSNATSLNSRIMVAGGGGGWNLWQGHSKGGDAGGLIGPFFGSRTFDDDVSMGNTGGEQEKGGTQTGSDNGLPGQNGSFGAGGSGYFGAGGGGWFGGSGGNDHPHNGIANGGNNAEIAGGGGSSFVSGFSGCKARSGYRSSSNVSVVKYSNVEYTFSDAEIWDGAGYKWNSSKATTTRGFYSPSGTVENGHLGNGYARIRVKFE